MNTEKKKISHRIFEKIENEKIKPIPKWHFVLKHGFLWIIMFLLMLTGSIALGFLYIDFNDIDWDIRPMLGMGILKFILTIFPYFWLVVFGAVAILAYYNFMSLPKGYRYPSYQILLFGILIIILTTSAIHFAGAMNTARIFVQQGVPSFENIINQKGKIWNLPDKGLLAGEVDSASDDSIDLISLDGRAWRVDIGKIDQTFQLNKGVRVKILGKKLNETNFEAYELRPWRRGEEFKKKDSFKNKLHNNELDSTMGPPPPFF